MLPKRESFGINSLSAGEERALLGHDVAVLPLRAELPGARDNAEHDEAHDGRILSPVRGLGVPTTRGRPNVLGVAIGRNELEGAFRNGGAIRRSRRRNS